MLERKQELIRMFNHSSIRFEAKKETKIKWKMERINVDLYVCIYRERDEMNGIDEEKI